MKLYQAIVNNQHCLCNEQWRESGEERQARIDALLPSGSGFDSGTKIEHVDDYKIVFSTSFHHMDEAGFYCGWTDHKVTIKASLLHGFVVHVSGRNKNDIKDYISEVFANVMSTEFEWLKGE